MPAIRSWNTSQVAGLQPPSQCNLGSRDIVSHAVVWIASAARVVSAIVYCGMLCRVLGQLGLLALAACVANDDVPAPGITGLMPDHGLPGAIVTVTGKYLCQQPQHDNEAMVCVHVGSVMFGATPGTVMSYTDTMVLVEVPARSAGRLDVIVSVAGRSSNGMPFVVD